MASARVTPLRGCPERDPERDPERGLACLCFFLAWQPCSARAGPRAGKQAWPLWSLQSAPARCIHSWPEWTPERDGVGPYLRLGPGLARAESRACLLWSLLAPLRGTCARPERDPKPVGAAPAKLRAYLWALKSRIRAWCFFRIMDLSFSCG